jgi:alkanesulfonate monooxygenase SsuD/methylene tetrahydromethanopterin reductase-like flavin-dependent oxidoreductase (luciferase family)
MVGLTRLATVTERVIVGSSVLLLPLYPPALVAKQIADLDRATHGRIVLGVGVGVGGEYPQEFRALQIPVEERGRRANEMIPLLRRLWSGAEISHDGIYYALKDVTVHPAPVQPGGPPIVVAGRKVPAMRRAATLGDGWLPYMFPPAAMPSPFEPSPTSPTVSAEILVVSAGASRSSSTSIPTGPKVVRKCPG